jgi:hypothetical protein
MSRSNPEKSAGNFNESEMTSALGDLSEKFRVTTGSGNETKDYGEIAEAEAEEKKLDVKRAERLEEYLELDENNSDGSAKELIDKLINDKLEANDQADKNILYRVFSILEDSQNSGFVKLKTKAYDYLEADSGTDKLAGITRGTNHRDGLLGERRQNFKGTKIAKAIRRRLKSGESIEDVYARYENKITERGIDPDSMLAAMTEYKLNCEFMLKTLEEQDKAIEMKREIKQADKEFEVFDNLRHKWEQDEINKSELKKLHSHSTDDTEKEAINKLLRLIDKQQVIQVKFGPRASSRRKREYERLKADFLNGELKLKQITELMINDPAKKNEFDIKRGAAISLYWDIIDGAVDISTTERKYALAA